MSIARRFHGLLTPLSAVKTASGQDSNTQELPWTVTVVSSATELRQALQLRGSAYGRHFGHPDTAPDDYDFQPNAFVLAAIEKRSGTLVGTMRIAFGVGSAVEMLRWHPRPQLLAEATIGEARRLALRPSRVATLVKLSLWKSFWLACLARGIELMLVAARPPLNDDYRMLLFEEPILGGVWFKPPDVPDEHELLVLRLEGLEERYRQHSPELFRFMVEIKHPDIQVLPAGLINPLTALESEFMDAEPGLNAFPA
jgi:hypothetical protein